MHQSVRQFAENVVRNYKLDSWTQEMGAPRRSKLLDIGSYDVNGNVRDLFEWGTEYTGLDVRPGPNVDVVAASWKMPFDKSAFETVVCMEMMEHDEDPHATMLEINRVHRVGGRLLITARGPGYPRHDYPADYHRFSPDVMGVLLVAAGYHLDILLADPEASGVMALATKVADVTRINLTWTIPTVE